jgi:hypothetical protein
VHREKPSRWPLGTVAWYVAAATAAGALTGALLGAAGSLLPTGARLALATLLALVAAVPAALEVAGRRCRLPQRDRETPKRWAFAGPRAWALRNGTSLGIGAGTRIGFAAWYAVPAGCLLVASAPFGALLYGLYGFTRAAAVLPIMLAARRDSGRRVTGWLFARQRVARRLLGADLLVLAIAVVMTAGV